MGASSNFRILIEGFGSRMRSLCFGTSFVLLPILLSGHANAHHAVAVHFDKSQSVKVRGTVVEFKLRSPHATIVIDGSIVGEDGNPVGDTERWEIASISAPGLRRLGMDRNTLKPGDEITAIGSPHRNPEFRFVHSDWFIAANGRVFRNAPPKGEQGPLTARALAEVGFERIEGRWRTRLTPETKGTLLPLNERGQSAWTNYDPKQSPANTCEPVSMPSAFHAPYLFDIDITDDTIILHNQLYEIVRKVPKNGEPVRTEPAGLFGTVRGRVEGDTLVVESRDHPPSRWGLGVATITLGGGADVPSSTEKSLVERYSVSEDGRTLLIDYTIEDPIYLSQPYSGRVELARVADDTVMDVFECDVESAAMFSRDIDEKPLRINSQ